MRPIDGDALRKDIERRRKAAKTLTGVDFVMLINDMPTVNAVPLDKLCLLLHDIAGCPCHTQPGEDMCNRLIGDYCNTEWDDIECWKQFLTKWMEGLE